MDKGTSKTALAPNIAAQRFVAAEALAIRLSDTRSFPPMKVRRWLNGNTE